MMSSQSRLLNDRISSVIVVHGGCGSYILLSEGLVEQPCYYGKVTALVVGGQKYRVLVLVGFWGHFDGCCAANW